MRLRDPAILIAALAALAVVNASGADAIREFLDRPWRRPLAHQRFGPPRRDGSLAPTAPSETLPHNGVTRAPAFLRSEFCQSCHQFTADGFALNGKLLENTYNEWKASRFAREGVQCQDCHMPDRRHLWRGVHHPEMVRSGVTIDASAGASRYRPAEIVSVTLTVENTRVGHAFP